MTHARSTILGSLFSVLLMTPAFSQGWQQQSGGQRMMRFNADDAVIMREVGAIITVEKGVLKVIIMPPPGMKSESISAVDMRPGDEVGMANGKRISTMKELKAAYESTKPGEEFKIGIRRDGTPHIVTFTRKAEKDMPSGGQMVIRTEKGGENEDVFPALGFGIMTEKGKTSVNMLLPNAPKEVSEGDEVISLNGTRVMKAADFSKTLDGTKIGGDLEMVFSHDGKEYTVKMKRPEPPKGMRMMKREQ